MEQAIWLVKYINQLNIEYNNKVDLKGDTLYSDYGWYSYKLNYLFKLCEIYKIDFTHVTKIKEIEDLIKKKKSEFLQSKSKEYDIVCEHDGQIVYYPHNENIAKELILFYTNHTVNTNHLNIISYEDIFINNTNTYLVCRKETINKDDLSPYDPQGIEQVHILKVKNGNFILGEKNRYFSSYSNEYINVFSHDLGLNPIPVRDGLRKIFGHPNSPQVKAILQFDEKLNKEENPIIHYCKNLAYEEFYIKNIKSHIEQMDIYQSKKGARYIKMLAENPFLSEAIQLLICQNFKNDSSSVFSKLLENPSLSESMQIRIAEDFKNKQSKNDELHCHIFITNKSLCTQAQHIIFDYQPITLAQNQNLCPKVQEKLFNTGDEKVIKELSKNPGIDKDLFLIISSSSYFDKLLENFI